MKPNTKGNMGIANLATSNKALVGTWMYVFFKTKLIQ
jgi:hypothetical protein